MKIRQLSSSDENQVQDLLKHKEKLLKEKLPQEAIPSERMIRLINDPIYRVYGAFIDDELIGVGAAELWSKLPYYNISNFFLQPGRSVIEYRNFCVQVVNQMMADMEALGRFQFYMFTLLRPYQKRSLEQGDMWRFPDKFTCFDRYYVTVEAVIKANEPAKYATHAWLTGGKTWSSDVWIRKGVLKNEFLVNYLNLEGRTADENDKV